MGLSAGSWLLLITILGGWLALAVFSRFVQAIRIRPGDTEAALFVALMLAIAKLIHRLRVEGAANIPADRPDFAAGEPLIIVANHASGADPILVQAAIPFEVRWIMAEDMRVMALNRFWEFARTIFIDRRNGDSRGLREALRHLKQGGALGLFPEGFIERPARALMPFQEGITLLIARSGAKVLPVIIEDTPEVDPAWAAILRPSRAKVCVLPLWTPPSEKGAAIGAELRLLFQKATGWPLNDRRAEFKDGRWWYIEPDGRYVDAAHIENRV